MTWQIEGEELDLAEYEHRTTFIEPSVILRSGEPARHYLHIGFGAGIIPHHNFTMSEKGELLDADGKVYDHRAKQQAVLKTLNEKHARARAWARAKGVPLAKGPRK